MTPSLSPGYRSTRFVSATRPSRICSLLILSFLSAAILAPAPLRAAVRFRFVVDPGLAPFQSGVERRSDGLRRRLAAIREPGGRVENFVVNEVVFQPQGAQDLTRFLQRYNGVVVDDGGIPDLPGPFVVGSSQLQEGDGVVVVRVDLGRAHVSNLATNATALGASGRFAFSSPGAVQLAAIIAAERVAGAAIGIDLVGPPTGVTKPCLFKTTHEEPTDPAAPDQALPNLGFQDGFKLNWLNDPDIEVAASWQYVAHNGHAGDVVYLAMIDGGFVPNQDFRAADLQWDFVHNRRDATGTNPGRCSAVGDCPYHGTATFSTAGAVVNNRFGAAGTGGQVVTPFLFKVDYSFSQVRRAVRAAVKWSQQLGHPAVINMSFGGSCGFFCWEQGLDDALTEAVKAGLVPVAAAGNHNKDAESEDFDPCTNSAVICVGAISPSRRRSSFSNYGGAVHIWAPGEDVETTPNPDPAIAPGDLPSFAGTSVAAPFVAGIVASMLALDPFLNRDSVLKILQETARPSSDLKVKPGYVDALRALRRTGLTDRVSSHFAGTGIVWHDFFAAEDEVPLVGDFNGDCRSDVVTFRKNDGAVFVALSDGTQFVGRGVQWLAAFCMGDEVCVVGDFDGDGLDDVAAVNQSTGEVHVALSTGSAFRAPTLWLSDFSTRPGQTIAVGNFNFTSVPAERKDDLALFVHGNDPGTLAPGESRGAVYVALSTGAGFSPRELWHDFFAPGPEKVATGDFDGDGRSDIVAFLQDCCPEPDRGDVYVALSQGSGFLPSVKWNDFFSLGGEIPAAGDFTGSGQASVATFDRSLGHVYVAVSTGDSFEAGALWHDSFCFGSEVCAVGDFDGDGRLDVIAFTRGSNPLVYVALSSP